MERGRDDKDRRGVQKEQGEREEEGEEEGWRDKFKDWKIWWVSHSFQQEQRHSSQGHNAGGEARH